MNVDTQDPLGSDFVGYRLDDVIGQGGMGVVYRAYDLRLKRTVALKLIAPDLARDERFLLRFARESELAMSLEHPNVVPIYDAGDVEGRVYLSMRYVDGTDLRALLRAEGALEPPRALAICRQVAAALDAAHARGLVHRDVKPSNVLLDGEEHVYLADFGLTRRLEEEGGPGEDRSVGTPAYLAPEQIEGGAVDSRTDVYALGCLLYECLTGKPPFSGRSRLAVAWAHLEQEPPPASGGESDLPAAVDGVLARAMAKSPGDRYPTCLAVVAAAEDALGLRRRHFLERPRVLIAAVAAAVFLLALAAALVLWTRDTHSALPLVKPNTLVRIDPATNAITDVVPVGATPAATAFGGDSVWVYNRGNSTVFEIDPERGTVRQELRVPVELSDISLKTGPVLVADGAGAWLIGTDDAGRGWLTRLIAHGGGRHSYRLPLLPIGVVVGGGTVWVLGRGVAGTLLLRVDPRNGRVMGRTPFHAPQDADSMTYGFGAVWVASAWTAMLYRVDPKTGKVTGRLDVGTHAGRPSIRFGRIWVPVSDFDGDTRLVRPRPLEIVDYLPCCPIDEGETATGFGSTWLADHPTGEVVRFDGETREVVASIPVTNAPDWGGGCTTDIAVGAGAVWVTVTGPGAYGFGCPT